MTVFERWRGQESVPPRFRLKVPLLRNREFSGNAHMNALSERVALGARIVGMDV